MTAHRLLVLAALTASFLVGSLLQLQPATAAEQEATLQLSTDGISYSYSLQQPVLPSGEPIVSGGIVEGPIWVLNSGDDAALLSMAALPGMIDESLEQELRVRTATDNLSSEQKLLGVSGSCTEPAIGLPVPAGESVRLAIDLAFDVNAANATKQPSAENALRLLLQDSRGGEAYGACADPHGIIVPGTASNAPVGEKIAGTPPGMLADTGASALPWLTAGAFAVGLGALLVALVRQRKGQG